MHDSENLEIYTPTKYIINYLVICINRFVEQRKGAFVFYV